VPYLPVDPADLGRSYVAVIRVNSQSGKGGIAYLLETEYGVELPRRLQIDIARHVQRHTDATGSEVTARELWTIFENAYLFPAEGTDAAALTAAETGSAEALAGALRARGIAVDVLSLHQASVGAGNGTDALTLVEYRDGTVTRWAGGRDRSVPGATLAAAIRAASTMPAATAIR